MFSVPGSTLLRAEERERFIDEFEKDLKFLQVFMLLMNRSCLIKNVDLVWVEQGPSGRAGWRHMGTVEALDGPCSRLLDCTSRNPHPAFCNIINDFGMHEAESCSLSDHAAAQRVSRKGRGEAYRCHFGLTDIAVPVIANGHHIATLFSGQALTRPPSDAGFRQIEKDIAHLGYVNVRELKRAYAEAPVVSRRDIRNTMTLLEVFAEYLAASWVRLYKAVEEERDKGRRLETLRKEFAYVILEREAENRGDVREVMERIGLRRCPNRVLMVKFGGEDDGPVPRIEAERAFTTAIHAIDELCEKLENVAQAYLRRRGVCVFFHDREGGRKIAGSFDAQDLAQTILHAIANRCAIRVRIGIGGIKPSLARLVESYYEANVALAASSNTIALYRHAPQPVPELSGLVQQACENVAVWKLDDARLTLIELPLHADRHFGADANAQRRFFVTALASLFAAARKLGCDELSAAELRDNAGLEVERAASLFDVQQAYLRCAESILHEVRSLRGDRGSKLVDRICHMVDRRLKENDPGQPITQRALAASLGISTSHLSRVFKQITGQTFERRLMVRRVELAKRLLLDPAYNVSQVAAQCGFADSSYFARVFRKIVGRSPAEYSRSPVEAAG